MLDNPTYKRIANSHHTLSLLFFLLPMETFIQILLTAWLPLSSVQRGQICHIHHCTCTAKNTTQHRVNSPMGAESLSMGYFSTIYIAIVCFQQNQYEFLLGICQHLNNNKNESLLYISVLQGISYNIHL